MAVERVALWRKQEVELEVPGLTEQRFLLGVMRTDRTGNEYIGETAQVRRLRRQGKRGEIEMVRTYT